MPAILGSAFDLKVVGRRRGALALSSPWSSPRRRPGPYHWCSRQAAANISGMANIPEDVKAKLNRAYEQVNPIDTGWTFAEATARATTAQISLTEGLVIATLEAEKRLSATVDRFSTTTNESNKNLARWTFWQAVSTVVLAGFTIAQVIILLWFPSR